MDSLNFWELLNQLDAKQAKEIASQNMSFALMLCFGSGILTSLTPCVYPIIPITINIFGRVSQAHAQSTVRGFNPYSFFMAIVYVAGMSVTYSILGLISGLTGALFGNLLQSSFMLLLLTLMFFSFSLSQLGLFKMSLPASWQTKLASVGHGNSTFGIFLMGLVSGLIVSPCVGPIIAGILAFVFESSNAFLGLAYFFSFSLGLGVLFLIIGGFSGVLNHLPRSGNWMLGINRVLALLLMIAGIYYGALFLKKVGLLQRSIPVTSTTSIWINSEKQALDLAIKSNKPIIVDFTAEWCEACHEIEKQVFSLPEVQERLKSNFITLRIDVTEENETNSEILERYGILSLPAILFLRPDGTILNDPQINGLLSPEEFLDATDQVLDSIP